MIYETDFQKSIENAFLSFMCILYHSLMCMSIIQLTKINIIK